jgi:hypothetical protein
MPETVSRLDQFRKQIDSENANFAVAQALDAIKPLPSRQPRKETTIALVASADTTQDFENTASLIRLKREAWRSQLAEQHVDLVLIETDYACLDNWRTDFFGNASAAANEIIELAAYCKKIHCPCALWMTLEREQASLLDHLYSAFETIFVADRAAYDDLSSCLGGKVKRIKAYVDTCRFNPAMAAPDGQGIPHGSMPVVSDCLASIMHHDPDGELLGILQKVMEHKVWLYESQDFIRPRESYMPAHMLRRSLGCLSRRASGAILKVSDVSIVLENAHRRSSWHHHRKILEAMASNCLPLSTSMEVDMFGDKLAGVADRYLRAETPDAIAQKLDALLSKRLLRERLQHLFFRETVTSHALDARLREIAATSDGQHSLPPPWCPKVSVILVTNRPENFVYALGRYRDQTYANKELIVIVNTDDTAVHPMRRQLRDSDNARVLGVPARWPIGVCLNAGISLAEGEFWAKFDDDDIYGPSYLADYVMNARLVDFDIAGKANIFTYDERTNRTVLRRSHEHPYTCASAFAGGTLFVKNRPGELLFNEAARGLVDIWFQWQHLAAGKLLYAVDPFNFMQVRRTDRRTHTWRIEVAEMGDAEHVADGLALDAVFA